MSELEGKAEPFRTSGGGVAPSWNFFTPSDALLQKDSKPFCELSVYNELPIRARGLVLKETIV
jgi:hypothetical protein